MTSSTAFREPGAATGRADDLDRILTCTQYDLCRTRKAQSALHLNFLKFIRNPLNLRSSKLNFETKWRYQNVLSLILLRLTGEFE